MILEHVGSAWGTRTLEELVNRGNEVPGPDFSDLAKIIAAAAEEGDSVATKVLLQAAQDLAGFILLVRHKLRHRHGLTEEVPVAFTGSVLERITLVRNRVAELLYQAAPAMPFAREGVVAVEGAVWRAHNLLAVQR